MVDYFEIDALSNSEMGSLRKQIYGIDEISDLEYHFAFGSLVDAKLTETSAEVKKVLESYPFHQQDIFNAEQMVRNCKKDPLIKVLLPNARPQYVFVRTISITYNEWIFRIKCKCKYDLIARKYSTGLDFKTLSVGSWNAFIDSINHFDYDRQAAFYMDIARINRFWIFAVSKINKQIYRLAIERDDEVYNRGKAKYQFWAFKYYSLIEGLTY